MARTVGIGVQDFRTIIENNYFYVDKTCFIKEWWESGDSVTLITRPRRFGKTLNMSMLEQFFSVDYAEQGDIFEGLSIWNEEKYRSLQGTYPVIAISFAAVKEISFYNTQKKICQIIKSLFNKYDFLLKSGVLNEDEKEYYRKISVEMEDYIASEAIKILSDFLSRYYGKKVIILLDEYDTPMQEAYVNGYWEELAAFTRSMFNAVFKTNPWLERGMMTGITRVSKESIFSDLNNLKVVTATSDEYAAAFGFMEEEVFSAMDEFGLMEKEEVKRWYDGFAFGSTDDIYNPWSIINFLDTGKLNTYWANTSSNSLVGKLIREGNRDIKKGFERLLNGESIWVSMDEQVVYDQLDNSDEAVWGLLLAGGYIKATAHCFDAVMSGINTEGYEITLTNYEVNLMFAKMIRGWFGAVKSDYNDFVKALLLNDLDAMNEYMNRVSTAVFSSFDTGGRGTQRAEEPERFYHGFVLGLIVELGDRYVITSNRESGFGRYDVVLEPKDRNENAIIIEFKVFNTRRDKTLEDTVQAALRQIEDKNYAQELYERGLPENRICKYGFAFQGKKVLIGIKADV